MPGTGLPQTEITEKVTEKAFKKTDQSLFLYPLFYIQAVDFVDALDPEDRIDGCLKF